MEIQSIVRTTNLPKPVFSSGLLGHRQNSYWQAQVCVARKDEQAWTVWVEYKEGFSENFEVIAESIDLDSEYQKALGWLARRGYLTGEANPVNRQELQLQA